MAKYKLTYALSVAVVALGVGLLTPNAWAETVNVNNEADLVSCVSTADSVCLLTEDIALNSSLVINQKDIQVNLNKHSITPNGNFDLIVIDGGEATFTGEGTIGTDSSWSPFQVKGSEDSSVSDYSVLIIDKDVTLRANDFAIWVPQRNKHAYGVEVYFSGKVIANNAFYINGYVQDVASNAPTFEIMEGADITSTSDHIIYAAGYGHWTFGDATLTGPDGIGIKAGTFDFNDTTVSVTGAFTEPASQNNGIYPSGTVLQLESNDGYADNIEININGGSYTSAHGPVFLEYKQYESTKNTVQNMTITGGTFSAGDEQNIFHVSDNFKITKFISGGEYSKPLDLSYIAEDYDMYDVSQDGPYFVEPVTTVELPDELILQVGETYTVELSDIAKKYGTLGGANDIVMVNNETITATATGSGLMNFNLHNYVNPFEENIDVVVYDVAARGNDDSEDVADKSTLEEFFAAQVKEALENRQSGIYVSDKALIDVTTLKQVLSQGGSLVSGLIVNEYSDEEEAAEWAVGYDELMATLGADERVLSFYSATAALTSSDLFYPVGFGHSLDASVTLRFALSEENANLPGTFSVVRSHYDYTTGEYKVSRMPFTRDGNDFLVENSEFSTFAITYTEPTDDDEDADGSSSSAVTPETGTMTREGASAMTAAIITSVAMGLLVSITSFAYLIRRR